jgi:hypothetical protein
MYVDDKRTLVLEHGEEAYEVTCTVYDAEEGDEGGEDCCDYW